MKKHIANIALLILATPTILIIIMKALLWLNINQGATIFITCTTMPVLLMYIGYRISGQKD